jgi:hypothetical protein
MRLLFQGDRSLSSEAAGAAIVGMVCRGRSMLSIDSASGAKTFAVSRVPWVTSAPASYYSTPGPCRHF